MIGLRRIIRTVPWAGFVAVVGALQLASMIAAAGRERRESLMPRCVARRAKSYLARMIITAYGDFEFEPARWSAQRSFAQAHAASTCRPDCHVKRRSTRRGSAGPATAACRLLRRVGRHFSAADVHTESFRRDRATARIHSYSL